MGFSRPFRVKKFFLKNFSLLLFNLFSKLFVKNLVFLLECCWSYKSLTFIHEQRYSNFHTSWSFGRRFSSPLLCLQIFMHDPWGGERPIDNDLLALLFEDQEQSSLPFSDFQFSQKNPTTSFLDHQPHMGRVKHIARRKKKTTQSPSNQPATNTKGPLNDPQPMNIAPPEIQPKARPRDGLRPKVDWYIVPPRFTSTRMVSRYLKKYGLPGVT